LIVIHSDFWLKRRL